MRRLSLDALVGHDLPAAERRRLEQAHELLLLAGSPPQLPRSLLYPPWDPPRVLRLVPPPPRRSRGRAIRALAAAAAVAVAILALAAGHFTATNPTQGFAQAAVVQMHGTSADPAASATISLGARDEAGNWPMRLSIKRLPPLPRGSYYQLYLTQNGRPLASCGTFDVDSDTTVIRLNAPYDLGEYDGWIITRQRPGHGPGQSLLTSSPA